MENQIEEDGPGLDGCDVDFTEDPVDDETVALLPLFPNSDPALGETWKELFGAEAT